MLKKSLLSLIALGVASASHAVIYQYDDGSSETDLSTSGPATFNVSYLTKFTAVTGGEVINSIDIVWGSRSNPNLDNGLSADVLLMSDPNNDGNPNDATVLASFTTTTVGVGSDNYNNYAISPTTFAAGQNFFAGAFIRDVATGSAWMGLDSNSVGQVDNSWWNVATPSPEGNYTPLSIFNLEFTPMVRANGSPVPEPATLSLLALGAAALLRRRRR